MLLPHLAARLFGVPLAIHRPKLDVILSVLGTRIGLSELAAPGGFVAPPRAPVSPAGHIAVIPIHGTLVRRTQGLEAESGLTSYAGIGTALDTALANPDIRAIVLDIDSRVGSPAVCSILPIASAPPRARSQSGPWPRIRRSRPPMRWPRRPAAFS